MLEGTGVSRQRTVSVVAKRERRNHVKQLLCKAEVGGYKRTWTPPLAGTEPGPLAATGMSRLDFGCPARHLFN